MKMPMIALLLSLPLSAVATGGKIVSESVKIKPEQRIQVDMDQGALSVAPTAGGAMTFRVEFEAERHGWFFGSSAPTARDLESSTASFDAAKGVLTIRTGRRLKAKVTIGVPAKQRLAVRLKLGTADIGPVTGKLDASVEVGDLSYDASALAAGVCVSASVKSGEVENERDHDCKSVGPVLRGGAGTISVN